MNSMSIDVFEAALGSFLNGCLKRTKWEIHNEQHKDSSSGSEVILQALTDMPVVVQYQDAVESELVVSIYKEFLREWYDKLEVAALEQFGRHSFCFSSNWHGAPDRMGEFFRKYLCDPKYAQHINASYPSVENAFGEKIIQVWAGAAIFKQIKSGKHALVFFGYANSALQDKDDIFHYELTGILETIG